MQLVKESMPTSLIRKKSSASLLDWLSFSYQPCILNCSGIDLTHPEFEGRAKFGTDTVDNPPRQDDPNGHGTHVAGEKFIKLPL